MSPQLAVLKYVILSVTRPFCLDPLTSNQEKVLGAHRAAIKKVILPARNAKEFQFEFGKHPLRNEMEVVFVSTIREGLEAAFGPGALTWRDDRPFVAESRL